MSEISPEQFKLFNVDLVRGTVSEVKLPSSTTALNEWVTSLTARIYSDENRQFEFHSDTVEVWQCLKALSDEPEDEEPYATIATRFLRCETKADKKYSHLKGTQKGSLVLIRATIAGEMAFVLAKVEHQPYIDESDLDRHEGLPFDRHIYKTCLVRLADGGEVLDLLLGDTSPKIADYWSSDFLEARELKSDESNTINAFNAAESLLKSAVKKKYPGDFKILRNNLVGYFRTHSRYRHSDMVEHVIGVYEPDDSTLDIANLRERLNRLPQNMTGSREFDSTFEIASKKIRARYGATYRVTDEIELRIKHDVPHIAEAITAVEEHGKKYIRIETDEKGFSEFKRVWTE